jgi:GTPase
LKEKDKTILAGIVSHGSIYVGMQYYLGPDPKGNFKLVTVENIHCKKVVVKSAIQGQYCSLQLDSSVNKDNVRKGMVLLYATKEPTSCFSFDAEIWNIENTESKIKYTLQPIVNISHIRQVVKIRKPEDVTDDELTITPGDITKVTFEFMYYPEYVTEGSHIIVLENSIKFYGYVTNVNI